MSIRECFAIGVPGCCVEDAREVNWDYFCHSVRLMWYLAIFVNMKGGGSYIEIGRAGC